ncbi:hypothetical protein EDD68_12823 [Melghiribacillus thermohalophilus]|uniref:Type I restriction modification DNA specificity protein n=1 Tax=Melghiribacillus thermohalophilus TaxID=1324956 RepID=A0A4R3MPU6_9BACI|nr:restriction endonuclease subunit S [Melghiribacillus thermohalophilus]TCT17575.1 hypothetical protein EDD68_12823 [Melghiribacillus thermohalophilus]
MQLGEIAEIKTGLVLTRKKAKLESETKATYQLISLHNIHEDGMFNNKPFEDFRSNSVLDRKYFTEKGDILFRLTYPHTAVYIKEEYEGLLVPSSFGIIKIFSNLFHPQYIAWFLNRNYVKYLLKREQRGSVITSTNKNILKQLEIKGISLEKQRKIVQLLQLHQKEKQLYEKLMQEKNRMFNHITKIIIESQGD